MKVLFVILICLQKKRTFAKIIYYLFFIYKMNNIKIKDKTFELCLNHSEIVTIIKNIAEKINKDFNDKDPIFLGVLNGVFMYAGELMKHIDFPCQVSFIKLASYSGMQSTNKIVELIGLTEDLKGRNIIILEDIIDTGITIQHLLAQLNDLGVNDIKIATFLFKPNAFKGNYKIDYVGKEIPNDFIVGYGFDYDGYGRNTKDIYKLSE